MRTHATTTARLSRPQILRHIEPLYDSSLYGLAEWTRIRLVAVERVLQKWRCTVQQMASSLLPEASGVLSAPLWARRQRGDSAR